MKAIRFGLAIAAMTLMVSVPAHATPLQTVEHQLNPNKAGGGTMYTFRLVWVEPDGTPLHTVGTDLTVSSPKGVSVDPGAAVRCSKPELLATNQCPKGSDIGHGYARGQVNTGGLTTLTADVRFYNCGPFNPGDAAGMCLLVNEPVTGTLMEVDARVVRRGGGLDIMVENFIPAKVLGVTTYVDDFKATVGKYSTVREKVRVKSKGGKKRTKTVTRKRSWWVLPRSCPSAGWPFGTKNVWEDGSVTNTTTLVPCTKR